MNIDLSALHSGVDHKIPLDLLVSFPKEQLENTDLLRLDDVKVQGEITRNSTMEDVLQCTVKGDMILSDSISLEEVNYPFSFEIDKIIDENDKIDENTLDLMEILWENIVLEIPLKFTKVEDLSKFHGDGWKLLSEDNVPKENNPFSDLLKEFGEE